MATVRFDFRDLKSVMMPDVCMRCGAPAEVRRGRQFTWHHPALYVTIPALLVYCILAIVMTKRRWVEGPFCAAHRNYWLWRTLLAVGGLGILVLASAIGFYFMVSGGPNPRQDPAAGFLCFGTLVFLAVYVVGAAVAQFSAIRPTEITDRSITLTNLAPEFAAAYVGALAADSRTTEEAEDDPWGELEDRPARDANENIRRAGRPQPPADAFESE